ncbi:hypothetical protein KM043_016168 [Ampulex compressa]|nr:hypothetical protein KM043_016168 [Ampulex compressa]
MGCSREIPNVDICSVSGVRKKTHPPVLSSKRHVGCVSVRGRWWDDGSGSGWSGGRRRRRRILGFCTPPRDTRHRSKAEAGRPAHFSGHIENRAKKSLVPVSRVGPFETTALAAILVYVPVGYTEELVSFQYGVYNADRACEKAGRRGGHYGDGSSFE